MSNFSEYTQEARRVIFFACGEATDFGNPEVQPEHLLLALLRENAPLGKRLRMSRNDVFEKIVAITPPVKTAPVSAEPSLSMRSKDILYYATLAAKKGGYEHIGTGHIFEALATRKNTIAYDILAQKGLPKEGLSEWFADIIQAEKAQCVHIVELATATAHTGGRDFPNSMDFLAALMELKDSAAAEVLRQLGVTRRDVAFELDLTRKLEGTPRVRAARTPENV